MIHKPGRPRLFLGGRVENEPMVVISRVTGAELRAQVDRLQPVYRQCFAAPPWSESPDEIAAYPERLDRHTGCPGAYGFLAQEGGEPAGAVYGWPAPAEFDAENEYDVALR